MAETINNSATMSYNIEGSEEELTATSNDFPITFNNTQGITVTKTASPTEFAVGDIITYTVRITNSGTNFLSGVRIIDNLGGGYLSYVLGSGSLTTSSLTYPVSPIATSPLTFTLQQLNAGNTMTLTYKCQVVFNLPNSVSSITNTLQAIGYTSNSTVNAFASSTITRRSTGNVLVTKSSNVSSVVPNQPFSYLITLSNSNAQALEVKSVTDNLPSNFTLTGATLKIGAGSETTLTSSDYTLTGDNLFTLPASGGPTVTVPAQGTTVIRLTGYLS